MREYAYDHEGTERAGEEFVARKIGHDTARSTYTVDRTPRKEAAGHEPAQLNRTQGYSPPERPAEQAPAAAIGQ